MIDTSLTLEELNAVNVNSLVANLGIEIIDVTARSVSARMPVDERTLQPFGIMHGGASAALAETVGSLGAYLAIDRQNCYSVGLDLKCNHIKAVREGYVKATARPKHIGRRTQVWEIEILNDRQQLVCFATHTVMTLPLDK